MNIKEKREYAKSLGIKSWHNKKEDKLDKEIAILEGKKTKTIELDTNEDNKRYLERSGFNFDSMRQYATEMGGTKLVYRARTKAFECYKEEQSIELLSISMFQ